MISIIIIMIIITINPNDSIIENGQNTEKNPGDLRRLGVTQTSVKNFQGVKKKNNNRLWHTNGSPNLGQKTRPYCNQKKKKKNLQNCGLCCTGWPQNKTERKWREELVPRRCLGTETTMEHEGDDYTNHDWCIRYSN